MSTLDRGHELGISQPDGQRAEQFGTALVRQRQQHQHGKEQRADPGKFEGQPVGDISGGQRKGDEQRRDARELGDLTGCEAGKEGVHGPAMHLRRSRNAFLDWLTPGQGTPLQPTAIREIAQIRA